MVRRAIKAVLILVVLVAGAFFLFGYWTSGSFHAAPWFGSTEASHPVVDTRVARERGAEIGEKAAQAAATINESLEEGSLTAKIKAKMVLDDLVKARTINVSTTGSTVSLTGTVQSAQEQQRAVQLAKETNGVTRVIDQLVVREP